MRFNAASVQRLGSSSERSGASRIAFAEATTFSPGRHPTILNLRSQSAVALFHGQTYRCAAMVLFVASAATINAKVGCVIAKDSPVRNRTRSLGSLLASFRRKTSNRPEAERQPPCPPVKGIARLLPFRAASSSGHPRVRTNLRRSRRRTRYRQRRARCCACRRRRPRIEPLIEPSPRDPFRLTVALVASCRIAAALTPRYTVPPSAASRPARMRSV